MGYGFWQEFTSLPWRWRDLDPARSRLRAAGLWLGGTIFLRRFVSPREYSRDPAGAARSYAAVRTAIAEIARWRVTMARRCTAGRCLVRLGCSLDAVPVYCMVRHEAGQLRSNSCGNIAPEKRVGRTWFSGTLGISVLHGKTGRETYRQ